MSEMFDNEGNVLEMLPVDPELNEAELTALDDGEEEVHGNS